MEADFFEDLGADSLSMAAFATAIRSDLGIRRVSMKRLYQNPSIAEIAASIDPTASIDPAATALAVTPASGAAATSPAAETNASETPVAQSLEASAATAPPEVPLATDQYADEPHVPSTMAYVMTGIAQLAISLTTAFLVLFPAVGLYFWIDGATGVVPTYLRLVASVAMMFFGSSAALIGLKWVLIGRFNTEPIRLWTWRYVRFWAAQRVVGVNPMQAFRGSPLYNVFLRLVGMKVGKNAVLMTGFGCVDLMSVGEGTLVREASIVAGYTAKDGYIYPGTTELGSNVSVGEMTVFGINTKIGDNSQLGTSSALHEGESIPANSRYQGSPPVPTETNFDRVPARDLSLFMRMQYNLIQVVMMCVYSGPLAVFSMYYIARLFLRFGDWSPVSGTASIAWTLVVSSGLLYLFSLVSAMFTVVTVPRIYNLFFVPNKTHRLYGVQYRIAHVIRGVSNNAILNTIFGDSSLILGYLSAVGYNLKNSTQTGSNFGVDQRHHSPFLCKFNRNTLVSDGLRMLNTDVTSTSFRVSQIDMPADTYLGNLVQYPAESKVGANCLIGTKTAVPIEGPVRENVGLLGSPAFEIPRSVDRDQRFQHFKEPGVFEERLRLKLRTNLITMAMYILRTWMLTLVGMAVLYGCYLVFTNIGTGLWVGVALALTVGSFVGPLAAASTSIFLERITHVFRPLVPLYCSLYDHRFWDHERFWKMNYNVFLRLYDGTPLKPFMLRRQGAKIGRKVFDNGAGLSEPPLVTIGDNAMLNFRSSVQCHSLEDGTFKSDSVTIGDSVNLGVNAFIHYGVTVADGTTIEVDSFVMKGTETSVDSQWFGNPARDTEGVERVLRQATTSVPTQPEALAEPQAQSEPQLVPDLARNGAIQ